jgi:cytoskeletal protein CcmA (bactofilin family)
VVVLLKESDMTESHDPPQPVGRGWTITGELRVQDHIIFEGQITGTLRSDGALELSPSARVSGTIVGQTIRVAGQVEADVVGRQEVELLPGSKVRGRLYANRLVVNDGAGFRGEIWVDDQAMQAADQEVLQKLDSAPASPRKAVAPDISSEELALLRGPSHDSRPLRVHGAPGNGR